MKIIRNPWTAQELKILRDAWVRGMTAKGISSMLLKRRTPSAIHHAMRRGGMRLQWDPKWKAPITVRITIPGDVYEQLRSLAAAQGVTVTNICRISIIQKVAK